MPPNATDPSIITTSAMNDDRSLTRSSSSVSSDNFGNHTVEELSDLNQGEAAKTIRKVLLAVQRHEQQRMHEGFNEVNFSVGVLNSMLVAYVFGNFPEHFWLLWLLEAAALIPRKIWQDWHALPLRQILYYFDYCWVMIGIIVASLYFLTMEDWSESIPHGWRKNMYLAVLGIGCGPLLGASATMPFVSMVFHDNKMMTSLFIHLTPPMLVYTFQWHSEEILEAWPSFFKMDVASSAENNKLDFFPEQGPVFLPFQGLGTVAGNANALYWIWYAPYMLWMTLVGLDLTRKVRRKLGKDGQPLPTSKYDTAFHCILRDGICEQVGHLFGRTVEESRRQQREGDYEYRDFCIIMIIHAISVWLATTVLAYICLLDKRIHACMIWVVVVITVFRGAQQYVYWVTSMSSKAVQEEFAHILQDVKEKES